MSLLCTERSNSAGMVMKWGIWGLALNHYAVLCGSFIKANRFIIIRFQYELLCIKFEHIIDSLLLLWRAISDNVSRYAGCAIQIYWRFSVASHGILSFFYNAEEPNLFTIWTNSKYPLFQSTTTSFYAASFPVWYWISALITNHKPFFGFLLNFLKKSAG